MQQVQVAMDSFQGSRLGTQRLAIERLNDRLHVLDQLDRAPLLYARLVTETARRVEFLRLHRTVRFCFCFCTPAASLSTHYFSECFPSLPALFE